MNRIYPITILRVFCLLQIFLLHYFAGIGLRDTIWIFSIAVPVFLLVSAYLYGLKHDEDTVLGMGFLIKRFKALAVVYYPFVLSVFIYYAITEAANIGSFVKSLAGELLFLPDFVTPLPFCGHLWFMQTLMVCYISLVICSRMKFLKKWFCSNIISLILLIVVILCGYIYRGIDLVYLFFYLWIYYNAKRISQLSSKAVVYFSVAILLVGYLLLSQHYEEAFRMGVYLKYIQTCIMAIITIRLFMIVFVNIKNISVITWLSAISMEFYLIHHLYVFNYPIYISLTVTLTLSVVLHFISQRLQILLFNKNRKTL
jgi:hypothetical protein